MPHDNVQTRDTITAEIDRRPRGAALTRCAGGCKGTGWRWVQGRDGDVKAPCGACNKDGQRRDEPEHTTHAPRVLTCPGGCKGTGMVWVRIEAIGDRKVPCPSCRADDYRALQRSASIHPHRPG